MFESVLGSFTRVRQHITKHMVVFCNGTSLLHTRRTLKGLVELSFNVELYYKDVTNLIASRHQVVASERHLKNDFWSRIKQLGIVSVKSKQFVSL